MNRLYSSWKVWTASLTILILSCSACAPESDQGKTSSDTEVSATSSPEQRGASAMSDDTTGASNLDTTKPNGVLSPGMAYADFRDAILEQGWRPVADPKCNVNVVGANHLALCADRPVTATCQLCEQAPELNSCSSDGYCLMKFQHARSREMLEVTSYGLIEDWNVPGEDSRLQILRWAITGSSGIANKHVLINENENVEELKRKDAEVRELKSYIGDNAIILASQRGDINGDGVQDVVLVLGRPERGEDQLGDGAYRSLLLLVRDDAGQLRKAGQNNRIVPCAKCGGMAGDPFGYVRVEKDAFAVLVEGGSRERWSDEYVFGYSAEEQGWLLSKVIHGVTDTITGEAKQTELTRKDFGKIRFEEFDPSKLPLEEDA